MSAPKLPIAAIWMTSESKSRLADGGNCKGAVPVHGKKSATANIPLFTQAQLDAYGATIASSVISQLEESYSNATLPEANADLRDDLAGKFAVEIFRKTTEYFNIPGELPRLNSQGYAQTAEQAYKLAAAMLLERSKP